MIIDKQLMEIFEWYASADRDSAVSSGLLCHTNLAAALVVRQPVRKADTFIDQSHAGCRSLRGFASGGCDECCNARTCALYKNVLYPKLGLSISWWMRAVLIRLRDAWPRRAAQSPPSPAGLAHGGLQQTDQTTICCEGSHDRSKLITVDSRIQ